MMVRVKVETDPILRVLRCSAVTAPPSTLALKFVDIATLLEFSIVPAESNTNKQDAICGS